MARLRKEDAHGTSRKKFAIHRMASATHNAQKPYGTDRRRELYSRGLRMLKDALTVRNTQTAPTWLSSHLLTISDSPLLVLMKMLCLRLMTLDYQTICLNVPWQSTAYSLTSNTNSAWTSHTTWALSTTQTKSTWEPLECQLLPTTLSGSTVTRSRTRPTTRPARDINELIVWVTR